MTLVVSGTRWCHLTWTTFRGRQLFKIAATAQFCERTIRDRFDRAGLRVDTIAIEIDRIHVLLEVAGAATRKEVLHRAKKAASRALRDHRVIRPWHRRIWDGGGWCAVLSNSRAVWAVRKHLSTLSQVRYPGVIPPGRVRPSS